MSSSSLVSHAAAAQANGGQVAVGSDPNLNHTTPTMIPGMSQPPNHAGPVQSDPYVALHRQQQQQQQHPGVYGMPQPSPDGYGHPQHPHAHHVVQYVPDELLYSVDPPQQGQGQSQVEAQPQEEEEAPAPPASTNANGKRKQSDGADGGARKRRQRAGGSGAGVSAAGGEEGEEVQDLEVGPNGGAKHWTEEEKTKFFTWMLTSDEHWDAFKTRMNTVFRECSAELFPGRKSYTALKSCYHRNLEVFKQVHAFQVFSSNHFRQMRAENPHAEQPAVEAMLDSARVGGLNVGNLNVKVIDRWYETGWYNLFKKRYREDPKTGLPTPYYGPPEQPMEPGPSSVPEPPPMMGLHPTIDPQLMASHSAPPPPQDTPYPPPAEAPQQSVSAMSSYAYSPPPPPPSYYREAGPSTATHSPPAAPAAPQPFKYFRSQSALPPKVLHGSPGKAASTIPVANGQRGSPFPEQPPGGEPYVADHHPQMAHALARLTTVTESLLGVCASMKEFLQQQVEESKVRTELMRSEVASRLQNGGGSGDGQGKEREERAFQKMKIATDMLKDGPHEEEIRKAAIECITKYFSRDL